MARLLRTLISHAVNSGIGVPLDDYMDFLTESNLTGGEIEAVIAGGEAKSISIPLGERKNRDA